MPCTLCGSNDHARAQCRWEEGTRNAIQDLINRVEGHKRNQDPPSTVMATFKAEQSFGQVGGVSELLTGIDQHHEKFTWRGLGGLIDTFKDAGPEFEVVGVEPAASRTGWPPGLLQDDSRGLSKWLASKPDARLRAREAAADARLYSREWFAEKAAEATARINNEWPATMKANSVYAAATLPCAGHAYQDDQDFVGDASYGCGTGPAGETE